MFPRDRTVAPIWFGRDAVPLYGTANVWGRRRPGRIDRELAPARNTVSASDRVADVGSGLRLSGNILTALCVHFLGPVTTSYEIAPCPACAAAHATQLAGADDLRAELEALWTFHVRRLRPDTPPVRLNDRVVFSLRPPLQLVRCATCGTVYRNPRERDSTLSDIYGDEALAADVMESLFQSQRATYRVLARRLTRLAGRPGRGLEVGSYVGAFLAAARDEGWHFHGVDVNAAAAAFARSRELAAECGTIESCGDEPASLDAVAIWNCFDQLHDPRAAAAAAARLLRPGGVLAVRIPNGEFYASVRPALTGSAAPLARAVLAHNNLLAFPYRTGFTPASLGRLLESVGFQVVHTRGDTLVPIADAWTRRWAAWEERLVKRLVRLFARNGKAPWIEAYARNG